jgi:hypothetical protein
MEVNLSEGVKSIEAVLADKTKTLPNEYRQIEQVANSDVQKYRNFVADTWLNIAKRERDGEMIVQPSTNVALFFEISDFVTQNRELCDSLGISYEQDYTFGFSDYFNKKEQPLNNEILHIHYKKEHIKMVLKCLFELCTSYLHIDGIERGINDASADLRSSDVFVSSERQIQSEDIQSDVYKFTFESFTGTFRKFLNSLRNAEVPLIVRGIEVEPSKQSYPNKQTQEYLLQSVPSRYAVTLEVLNLPKDLTRLYRRDAHYMRRKAIL